MSDEKRIARGQAWDGEKYVDVEIELTPRLYKKLTRGIGHSFSIKTPDPEPEDRRVELYEGSYTRDELEKRLGFEFWDFQWARLVAFCGVKSELPDGGVERSQAPGDTED